MQNIAGRGRSAAIAICYLLRTYDLNLNECQSLLIEKRPQVTLHGRNLNNLR